MDKLGSIDFALIAAPCVPAIILAGFAICYRGAWVTFAAILATIIGLIVSLAILNYALLMANFPVQPD